MGLADAQNVGSRLSIRLDWRGISLFIRPVSKHIVYVCFDFAIGKEVYLYIFARFRRTKMFRETS